MSVGLESLFVDHGRPATRGQRIIRGTVVLFVCAIMCAAAAWFTRDAIVQSHWQAVPGRVLNADVDVSPAETEAPYALSVLFEYTVDARLHLSTVYRTRGYRSGDAAEVYALARSLTDQRMVTCYVNPADHDRAVLDLPSATVWIGISAAMAAVSLALLIFYAWPQITRPPPRALFPRRGERVWVTLLLVACLGGGCWTSALPLWRTTQTAAWIPVPAVVEHARLIAHEQHGEVPITLYRTDLLYRYTVNGVEYYSNQYSLTEIVSPLPGGRRRRVETLAATPRLTCWTNPRDPQDSVLSRRVSPTQWLGIWLFGGAALCAYALVPRRRRAGFDAALRRSRWTIGAILIMLSSATLIGMTQMP